jgi:hypothetical protein
MLLQFKKRDEALVGRPAGPLMARAHQRSHDVVLSAD